MAKRRRIWTEDGSSEVMVRRVGWLRFWRRKPATWLVVIGFGGLRPAADRQSRWIGWRAGRSGRVSRFGRVNGLPRHPRNNHLSLAQTSTIMSTIFKSSLRKVVYSFLKYVWMEKCVEICVILFKMWKSEFEIDDQTDPKFACNWSMYVYLIIYIYIYIYLNEFAQ